MRGNEEFYEDYNKEELDEVSKAYVSGIECAIDGIEKVCDKNTDLCNQIRDYLKDEINEYIMRTIDSAE